MLLRKQIQQLHKEPSTAGFYRLNAILVKTNSVKALLYYIVQLLDNEQQNYYRCRWL